MKTRLIVFIFLLSVGAFAYTPTSALTSEEAARKLEAMTWYTEEYAPYNYKGDDGLPTGISVDILMAAFKKIGVGLTPGDIKIVPWNRSYKFIQRKPKTALFSMTYSPERLAIMKFVGPVVPNNVSVIAPRKKEMGTLTAKDLGQFKLGVVRDDIGDQLLRKFALSNEAIQRKNSLTQLLFLLRTGRVDAVAYSVGVFKHAMKRSGQNPDLYEEVLVLKQGWMGYAFHHSTEPEALVPLQEAIDELHADGTIKKIIDRYGD